MGGFFSSAPEPAPAPESVAVVDPEVEARKQRLDNMDRNRRGRAGTVTTSERGVLEPVNAAANTAGKSLLGE